MPDTDVAGEMGAPDSISRFTIDELSLFKRYLEENIVCPDVSTEYLEDNMNYYSMRHTNGSYFSPAESFHANSDYVHTDEQAKNHALYKRAIEWHSATVHPADSEYVVKKEKYVYTADAPLLVASLSDHLNTYPMSDYFALDVLLGVEGETYQYLPQKNFLFCRSGGGVDVSQLEDHDDLASWREFLAEAGTSTLGSILPVFTPIRRMLFAGEAGYRLALLEYGRAIERMATFLAANAVPHRVVSMCDNAVLNALLALDGIERSVLSVIVWAGAPQSGEGA